MCIIVAKPAGIPMPTISTLKTCWENNSDGAGIMWADGGAVQIRKGFMAWEDFADALDALGDLTDRAAVLHFRITTHGGTRPECCHPFPVSSCDSDLRATSTCAPLAAAHNGIISGMSTDATTSDTMAYIRDVLAPLSRAVPSLIYSDDVLGAVEVTLGSKMALLDASGELVTLGKFEEVGGVLYSNDSYAAPRWGYRSYSAAWSGYAEAYAKYYGADDEDGAAIADLSEILPWEACEYCDMADDCASLSPYCETDGEAWDTLAKYEGFADSGPDSLAARMANDDKLYTCG